MKQIWRILEPAVLEVFGKQKRLILDQWMNEHWIIPWLSEDFEFNVYDWQKFQVPWTEENRKSFSIWSHESFLELPARLQSDLHYYSFTAPEKLKDFNCKLLEKLRAALKEGYQCFELVDGEPEFDYRRVFGGDCAGRDLKTAIASIKKENQHFDEESSEREENYQNANNRFESTAQQIDSLYRKIFVWCLEHHQEEGVNFSNGPKEK